MLPIPCFSLSIKSTNSCCSASVIVINLPMQLWFLFLDFQKLKETREILVSPVVMVYIAAGILDKTDPCQLLRNWIFENNQFCTRYFYWVFCMFFISKYVNLSSTMHTPRRFCYQECT
jgi:hypothetical protein